MEEWHTSLVELVLIELVYASKVGLVGDRNSGLFDAEEMKFVVLKFYLDVQLPDLVPQQPELVG